MNNKKIHLTIVAGKTDWNYWKDLWNFRELFYFLAWRDIIVRFKQKVLGFFWTFLRPIFSMIVMTVIFGKLANLPSDGAPYAVMVFTGVLPWQFFSGSVQSSTFSVLGAKSIVTKVYFPRMILPSSAILVNIIDFCIAFMVLGGLMLWFGLLPTWRFLTIPFFLAIAVFCALGLGLWFSALNVKYRDVKDIVPMLLSLGTYISPVAYSATVVPDKFRLLYSLNPMVAVIDGFRWAILGGNFTIYAPSLLISIALTISILISGVWYFRRTETIFDDVI